MKSATAAAAPDLVDSILASRTAPRKPKRNHPGGTKGPGTRGGLGRNFQLKTAVNPVERARYEAALAARYPGLTSSEALRELLIALATLVEGEVLL